MHRCNARLPSWVLSHFPPKKEMREMGSCLLICNNHREREISLISLLCLSQSSYFSLISPMSLSFLHISLSFLLFLSHFSYVSLLSPISLSFSSFLSHFPHFSLIFLISLSFLRHNARLPSCFASHAYRALFTHKRDLFKHKRDLFTHKRGLPRMPHKPLSLIILVSFSFLLSHFSYFSHISPS